jgi:hypothetical protein
MPTTSTGSKFTVPLNSPKQQVNSLLPKIGQTVSQKELSYLENLRKYEDLTQLLEVLKDLFVDHQKTTQLNELVFGLEELVVETKNRLKLELVSNLKSET